MYLLLPAESLPEIDFKNTRNEDAGETARSSYLNYSERSFAIYLTLQISMKTNRVASQTTKTKVTTDVMKMRLLRYLRKERKQKKKKIEIVKPKYNLKKRSG